MTREETLKKANEIVNGKREGQYGSPEDNFLKIAGLWGVYLERLLSPVDVAHMMILLKIARASSGKYLEDNYIDICGYAACASEILSKSKMIPPQTCYCTGWNPKHNVDEFDPNSLGKETK